MTASMVRPAPSCLLWPWPYLVREGERKEGVLGGGGGEEGEIKGGREKEQGIIRREKLHSQGFFWNTFSHMYLTHTPCILPCSAFM